VEIARQCCPQCVRSEGAISRCSCHLFAGVFKALLLVFASMGAWYSGYLLAELIPDMPLSSAVYNIRSLGERPVLKGECGAWGTAVC
jgi:hypothetical protein